MSEKKYTITQEFVSCPMGDVRLKNVYHNAAFKFLALGREAFYNKVEHPNWSWREIAEVVSPLGKVLNGETVKEHALMYVEKVWLGDERMMRLLKRKHRA